MMLLFSTLPSAMRARMCQWTMEFSSMLGMFITRLCLLTQ